MAKQIDLKSLWGKRKDRDDDPQENKTTDSPSTSIDLQCKPKRERKFQSIWLSKYNWLQFRDERMYCNTCISAKSASNPFTEGCINFQNSTLIRHQDSKVHANSLQVLNMRSNFVTASKAAHDQSTEKTTNKINDYVIQLRTVYVMAKRDLPSDVFTDLMHLQNLNGIKCDFYKRPQVIMEMEQCIEKVISDKITEQIHGSDFIGLMLDETCDISVHKKLAIYARYLVQGEVSVAFLGNEQITDCTALGIETALINFLVRKGFSDENVTNVLGLGTDGASVMTGRLNGLGAKLKARNPKITQVHCVAHRINLAASQAGKTIDYCKKYHEMIHSLYRYYSDSSVRYDRLRELQELLIGKSSQITEPTSVRWLSVESAVKTIFANYEPVYQSLESDRTAGKADGLLKFISNIKFLLFTALLIDVLTVVGILSLTFQKDLVNVSHVRHSVSATKETLITMKTGSETVTKVFNDIGAIPADGAKNMYKGLEVTDNQHARNEFNNLRQSYIDKLVQNLSDRFPEDQLQTLECLDTLLNPKRYPDQAGDLANYGVEQLDYVLNLYDTLVDAERAKAHFLLFKHFSRSQRALSFDKFTKMLINDFSDEYPDFVVLAKIAMVIPVSSAPCERGFSVQNALKTRVRNRLNAERLNRLMFIKLVGPTVDMFDFLPAARLFAQGAEGRL